VKITTVNAFVIPGLKSAKNQTKNITNKTKKIKKKNYEQTKRNKNK